MSPPLQWPAVVGWWWRLRAWVRSLWRRPRRARVDIDARAVVDLYRVGDAAERATVRLRDLDRTWRDLDEELRKQVMVESDSALLELSFEGEEGGFE